MGKLLKILAWIFGIILLLVAALYLFGPSLYRDMTSPDHAFGEQPIPAAPNYHMREHWAAWPDDASPAERLPDGVERVPQEDRPASAFFLHPTTYGDTAHWVQPMDHAEAIAGTDVGTISRQASAFNGCCRVYAPRYRQANLASFNGPGDELERILSTGYEDVRAAFYHFLETIGPDEPFVLASHSQGSFRMVRLLQEEVDGTPLADRLIAAYVIGHSLPSALVDEGLEDIEVCKTATQTGCFITWDAHKSDKTPGEWDSEDWLWNGTKYGGFAPSQGICVNPITWRTDSEASDRLDHLGALSRYEKDDPELNDLQGSLGELITGTVSAHCEQGELSNWLFVDSDRDERTKYTGFFASMIRNLHGLDYDLFWGDIRQNAIDRSRAFLNGGVAATASQPNVVVIFADDVGYCDSELYGCDAVPTPNIKRLADAGMRFTAGYVTSPVCSPSRAGLMTGRYQHRFGHEFLPEGDATGNAGLPVAEKTIAEAMQDAGYVTGMVGKWHLGKNDEYHPLNRGFDEFFGMVTWGADYADPTRDDVIVWTHPLAPARDPEAKWAGRGANTILRGEKPVAESAYLTDAFSREAVAFIEANKNQPFFLYLPYTAIHGPLQVTQRYYDRFPDIGDEAKRIYAAMTSALDDGVGEILAALETNGLEQNTLVIFMSDNGAGVAEYANNAPLRLGKHTLFEGGVRVPYAIKWPAQIAAGSVFDNPVSTLDVLPTVVAAAGGNLPADKVLDGVDLLPFIKESRSERPHDALFWRQGPNWAVRQGDWKLIHAAGHKWLYNLADDIGELSNIVEQHPEVVERLTRAFDEWNVNNVDPLWPALGGKSLPSFSVDGVAINWVL
ncbi:MAG: sulfatase-like hydrolase/transferase [Pseudomonadota bacterium]